MADEQIRVGLIGAGGNVRVRHIPGFQGVDDCEIVAVANRSIESGRAIATNLTSQPCTGTGGSCSTTTISMPCASAPGPICTAP